MGDRISTMVAAHGRWRDILPRFGFTAKQLNGESQACPGCGGKDRFRFDDRNKDGDYYCNQCGAGKGIKLIMITTGWKYAEAAGRVDHVLRTDWHISMHPSNRPHDPDIKIAKSVRDCALWLRKWHPEKLDAWLDRHYPEVRWWLKSQT